MQLLEQVLGSRNNIRVLRYLVKHLNWEFNISELSKDTGINKGALSRLIKKLKQNNTIKINQKGKIILFKLNKENIIMKNLIIPLFKKEDNFFNQFIRPKLLKLKAKNALSIILYGSYARNDFKLSSDLDLLIIVKSKDTKFENEIDELKKEFLDNDILVRTDIMALNEFKKLYKIKEPLIMSIEKNHEVLYGKNLTELIK
ncbi:MAG: nucleotidyltransferase domain-containing protein [Nanoarchaeota archaeon]|mgnify:FL=1